MLHVVMLVKGWIFWKGQEWEGSLYNKGYKYKMQITVAFKLVA